jgi:hypothetical protein
MYFSIFSLVGKREQIFPPTREKKITLGKRQNMQHFLVQTETFSESCQVLKTEVYNRNCLVTLIIAFGTILPIMSKHLFKALVGL